MTEIWERQKGESSKSFAWFKIYRNLGPLRTFKKVIEYCEKEKNVKKCQFPEEILTPTPTLKQLGKQSSRWEWNKRTIAWDNYNDYRERLENDESYKLVKDRLTDVGEDLLDLIQQNIDELTCDTKSQPTSRSHAIKSISDSYEKVTKTKRLLHGKSTENKESNSAVEVDAQAVVQTENNHNLNLTTDEFMKQELQFLKDLIDEDD